VSSSPSSSHMHTATTPPGRATRAQLGNRAARVGEEADDELRGHGERPRPRAHVERPAS
jgi:hypothetical protein